MAKNLAIPSSQQYYNNLSSETESDWKNIYILPRIVSLETNVRIFHYKLLETIPFISKKCYLSIYLYLYRQIYKHLYIIYLSICLYIYIYMIYICIHIFCFPLDSAIFNSQSTIKSIVKPSEPKQIADMSYLF